MTEETKRKMSESAKKRCATFEWKQQQKKRRIELPLLELIEARLNGSSYEAIARHYGCSWITVMRNLKR